MGETGNLDNWILNVKRVIFHPFTIPVNQQSVKKLFSIYLLVLLACAALIRLPMSEYLLDPIGIQQSEDVLKESAWELLILGVILAPLFEEVAFRLPLKRRRAYFWIALIFSLLIVTLSDSLFIQLLIAFYSFCLVSFHFLNPKAIIERSMFFISAIVFALFHASNFEYEDLVDFIILSPLIFSPHFIAGYFCGILRRYKFQYALLLHASYNFILIGGYLLFESFGI